jgi:hypothetical protein
VSVRAQEILSSSQRPGAGGTNITVALGPVEAVGFSAALAKPTPSVPCRRQILAELAD